MSFFKNIFYIKFFIIIYKIKLSIEKAIDKTNNLKEFNVTNGNKNISLINCTTNIYKIINTIEKNKTFFLIYVKTNSNEAKRSPNIYISKNANFKVLDYFIKNEFFSSYKIAIPMKYSIENFYLKITCIDKCKKEEIYFESVEQIKINKEEKFFFYSKDKNYNLIINPIISNKNLSVALILTSKYINKIKMNVNNGNINKFSNDILYTLPIKSNNISSNINVVKGSNFIFYFFEIDNIIKERDIFFSENNFYYLIKGKNTFNIRYLKNNIPYELTILCTNTIKGNIYFAEKSKAIKIATNKISYFILSSKINIFLEGGNTFCKFQINHMPILKDTIPYKFYLNSKNKIYHSIDNYGLANSELLNNYYFFFVESKSKIKILKNNKNISPINGYFEIMFNPEKDNLSKNQNNRNIIVECMDTSLCEYDIKLLKIKKDEFLLNNQKLVKYLRPNFNKHKYTFFIKNNITINLNILSGYAYFNISNKNIEIKKEILGNNQRILISKGKNPNEIINFNIETNKEGAIYHIFYREIIGNDTDIVFPLEIASIANLYNNSNQIKFINSNGKNVNIQLFFNPINCHFNIAQNGKSTDKENYLNFSTNISESKEFTLKKLENYNNNNNKCLFFFGTVIIGQNFDSSLILSEGISLRFSLNKNFQKLTTKFFYVYNSSVHSQIYLSVSLINKIPIKVEIIIGELKKQNVTYYLLESKNILIFDSDWKTNNITLKEDSLSEIKMTFEFIEKPIKQISVFDLNIKTLKTIPKLVKQGEIISDIIINSNNINYYYTPLNYYSDGEVKLDFKRGTGNMFGIIVKSEEIENQEWTNIDFFNKSKNYLNYDIYDQNIKFTSETIKNCSANCYLIFYVKKNLNFTSKNEKDINNENYSLVSEFNILFLYSKNYSVFIQSGQYIYNKLSNQNQKYIYITYTNSKNVFIEFKSDNCFLEYKSRNEVENHSIYSYGKNIMINISNIYDFLDIYIKENNKNDINIKNENAFYKLKVYEPNNLMKNINLVDTNHPIYCDESNLLKENNLDFFYYDFLISLDNIYKEKTIVEIAVNALSNINHISLYYNIYNSNEFNIKIINNKNWEKNITNNTNNLQKNINYINIIISEDCKKKNLEENNNIVNLALFVRVYINKISSIEFHSFIHSNIIKNKNPILINPFLNEYQYLICFNNNEIKINIPNDNNYYLQFISIDKEAIININGKEKTIQNGLILNNIKNQKIIIKAKNEGNNFDNAYKFFLLYKKNNNIDYQNKKYYEINKFKYEYKFIYYNMDNQISFLMNLKGIDFQNNLYYYIYISNFDLDNSNDGSSNLMELEKFDIKANFLNEDYDEISNNEKNSNISIIYDPIYKLGRISITSDMKIENPKKSLLLEIKIESKLYNLIEGNLFFIEEYKNKERINFINIPKDLYIFNYFENKFNNSDNKNKTDDNLYHVYKLDFGNSSSEKKVISFSTISKNVSINLFNKNEKKLNYNLMKNMSEIGKSIIIINDAVNEIYLQIQCPKKNYNVDYTFKYYIKESNSESLKYNKSINFFKSSNNGTKINLSISKITPLNNDEKTSYYIRIYNNTENLGDLDLSTSFRSKNPIKLYKFNPNNKELLSIKNESYFNKSINSNISGNYFIEVIAEVIDNEIHDYFSYERIFPQQKSNNSIINNKFNIKINVIIIISIIGGVILIILIFVFIILAIKYRKKHINLEEKVLQISFKERKFHTINNSYYEDDDDYEDELIY